MNTSALFILLALLLLTAACLCLYLASPNQLWLSRTWRTSPAVGAGAAGLALSFWTLLQAMQPLTAGFFFITALMLIFPLLAYLGAWRRARTQTPS